MKLLLLLLILPFSFSVLCQTDTVFVEKNINYNKPDAPIYKKDTFVFQSPYYRQILVGTSIVNTLENYRAMNIHGFDFYKIESSGCDNNGEYLNLRESKILNITKNDTLLITDINIYDNCGYSFLCEIEIVNDSTLKYIAKGYGHFFLCDCCYTLRYYIKLNKDCDTDKVEYFIINDDKKTIQNIKNLR